MDGFHICWDCQKRMLTMKFILAGFVVDKLKLLLLLSRKVALIMELLLKKYWPRF